MKKLIRSAVFSLCSISLGMISSQAVLSAEATGSASVTIVKSLSLHACGVSLNFGKIFLDNDNSTSFSISTVPGASTSGFTDAQGTLSAGEFDVSGEENYEVQMSLISDSVIVEDGDKILEIDLDIRETDDTITLDDTGVGKFHVDGTIKTTDDPEPGNYNGTYDVTVNYI